MTKFSIAAALALLAAPAFADGHATGDAAAGEEAFMRQCVSCHVVADGDGNVLAGRNARTGPNLYNLVARGIGMHSDFDYGDSIVEFGATGETWTEAHFTGYVMNPTGYLREVLEDRRARAKMAFQVREEADAINIYAYLAGFAE